MPIRINLLAEQQEAEEARRRDPVKRGLWVGASVIALTILFSLSLQFRLNSARSTVAADASRLESLEPEAKEVRSDWQRTAEIEKRTDNLLRYATNRFYWAMALDALQRLKVDSVRIVALDSVQGYTTNSESRFRTNIVFPRVSRSKWQFWRSVPQTNVLLAVSNQFAAITNRAEYLASKIPPVTKLSLETNDTRIVATIEIVKPATATERVTLTIDARDYSDVPGRRVDEFSYAIASLPYFRERLHTAEGQGIRLKERAIRPEFDPQDPVQPNKPFVPFTIECKYKRGCVPMNKINKEKRDRLVLIGVGTALISLAFYFFVICPQRQQIEEQEDKIVRTSELLNKDERWIRQRPTVQSKLSTQRQALETRQTDMAPLDKFKWFYNTLESFNSSYDVNLVDITREPEFGEAGVLPNFPYTAAIFGLKLNATYHDFGKFLADFENRFPYMRVQNVRLELDPAQKLAGTNAPLTGTLDAHERLAISVKVVTLVKPTTPL